MRQIVCISTSNYYPIPTRKQNVMNRLSDAEIIYIDPPVSYIAPIKDKKTKDRLSAWKKPGQKVRDNVTVYAAPPVIPFFNKHRWINRMNQKRLAKFLNEKIKEHGFEKPILWCYSPTSCDVVDLVENSGVIYDCVDRHSAYQGMIDPAVVDRMEEDLAKKSSQVFCTAQGLYDTLITYNGTTKLIPNGAAYEIFSKAAEPAAAKLEAAGAGSAAGTPAGLEAQEKAETTAGAEAESKAGTPAGSEVKGAAATPAAEGSEKSGVQPGSAAGHGEPFKKPTFGFVGMLQECIDYDCICAVADAWPEGEVVMIGRSLPGVDLSPLEARKNIRLQGLIPQTDLPDFIRDFDVCLNVFREGRLSKDVSPLKFYEYLATGKPIVSTGEPLQVQDFADVVHIAHNKEDFVKACADALQENDPSKTEQRLAYGRQCSWDERVKQMEDVLRERGLFQ